VATPDSPAWPEEVGNRVSWMVGQHESQAELTLTPPQLGKIEVSITDQRRPDQRPVRHRHAGRAGTHRTKPAAPA
jgi:hypothetical protein